jgi:hypothetical protein
MAAVPQGEVQAVDLPFGIGSGDAAFVPAEFGAVITYPG